MYKLVGFVVILALMTFGYCDEPDEYICYRFDDEEVQFNRTCVLLNATITIYYQYSLEGTTYNNVSTINCSDLEVDASQSICNKKISDKQNVSRLVLFDSKFTITFNFTGGTNTGNRQWSVDNINVIVRNTTTKQPILNGSYTSNVFGYLDYQRYYMCNSNSSITGFNVTAIDPELNKTKPHMNITLSDLKIQAFDFGETSELGDFGNALRCNQDIQGSKIVPIAVGAALAGLVIIVLIAYIIGRIRSRRQSSYEALS